jgi:cysteinyl-tRNA synthetase
MLIGSVLGIFQDKSFNQVSDEMQQKIEELIIKRENAKKDKNFDMADQIRNELNELGIEIKDTSDGTSWNVKS